MKKSIFLFFGIIFLIFLQMFTTDFNRLLTFHPKEERGILLKLDQDYLILDGNLDRNIGSSPKAIYKATLRAGYVNYIVLAREKRSSLDYLLLVDPLDQSIINKTPLGRYQFQQNSNNDFRGLLDLNNDRNLEMVCVVNGKSGKRIKIYKILTSGLYDLPIPCLENYTQIQINDFNIDGTMDIVCYSSENGVLMFPMIYKLQGESLVMQDNQGFNTLIRAYENYLRQISKRTFKAGNPVIQYDLNVAKARMYALLDNEKAFNQVSAIFTNSKEEDNIAKRIRIYRILVLKAYFSFKKGDDRKGTEILSSAIEYRMGKESSYTLRSSTLYAEKAVYHLSVDQWDLAKEELEHSLQLDPDNVIAGQWVIWMGNS